MRLDSFLRAVRAQFFDALRDVGALVAVEDGQAAALDGLHLCAGCKPRRWNIIETQRQQLIFSGGVDRLEAEFPRKALVGEPRLLLLCAQHADAASPLRLRVRDAALQQAAAQGALPLIAHKDHGALGPPQVVL